MKIYLPAVFFLFALSFLARPLTAQYLELGVHVGSTAYSGDLSPREFGFFVTDLRFAGGAYLRYRPQNRVGIRINGTFGRVGAERDLTALNEFGERVAINRNFRSKIEEISALLEYDLFYIGDKRRNFGTLYLYGGVGILNFKPQSQIDGVYYDLQPLKTEGQGIGGPRYAEAPYQLTRAVFPLGFGIRARFSERIVLGIEVGGRVTGTDYLDDISDTRVNYLDVLENSNSLGARFSNPAVRNVAEVGDLDYRRGGEFNDYYYTGSITLGITLGEGGRGNSGTNGCYKF